MNSEELSNASILHKHSSVTIECKPEGDGISCVLIYRMYGNQTLHNYDNTFPVTITLDSGNYTFSLFRSKNNNGIDDTPFLTKFVEIDAVSSPTPSGK